MMSKKNRQRKQSRTPQQITQQRRFPPVLERVRGAEFQEPWTIEKLQAEIDKIPKRDEKLRVLFLGEASFLQTGFSHYWHNVISRLYETGKFDVLEIGSYASTNDPQAKKLPWKFVGVMPEPNDPNGLTKYGRPDGTPEQRARYRDAQFGKYIFDEVIANFKADFVFTLRDHWMDKFVGESVFRNNFHWAYMACVDSYPQKWDWLQTYGQADTLLAYSHFGKRTLEVQSRSEIAKNLGIKPLNVKMVCQPGIDTEIYKPMDREEICKKLGIPSNLRFVGTVMRNQKRKLYPRLIESFRMFKEQNGWRESDPRKKKIKNIDDIKLFLHTSIRDVGFDIPESVRREGLQTEVYYSWLCVECNLYAVGLIQPSHPGICPRCGKKSLITPNTRIGLPDQQFAEVFNLFDVYVQPSIAEGDCMPVQNAKSSSVPTIMSDFSALYEKARNGGGIPIKGDIETESETMQWRFWFDRQDLVDKLTKLFKKPDLIKRMGAEARRCAQQYYEWDLTAKKWEYILDSTSVKDRSETWDKPAPKYIKMPLDALHKAENMSDEEFVARCYRDILGREPDEDGFKNWMQDLQKGRPRDSIEKYFRSITGRNNRQAELLKAAETGAAKSPLDIIMDSMDKDDTFRILYCMPETAGDILVSTAIIAKLHEQYPAASIYFATQKRYFSLLEGNPHIKQVFEYSEALANYRVPEPFGPSHGFVDLCFCPFFVTQRMPHWIHGGLGNSLGVTYAHMCGLTMSDEEIRNKMYITRTLVADLPEHYVTFQMESTQGPKNYDNWQLVFERIKDLPVVQVGGLNEKLLDYPNVIDMRGKTTPQELAYIIQNADLHIGVDSFPAHVASAVGMKSIIVFGGTYYQQSGLQDCVAIEPPHRGECVTSCHLVECILQKKGGQKCINNIVPDSIVEAIAKNIDAKHIAPPKEILISAYAIIKDGNKFGFPYKQCIEAALKVVDEVIIVDGFSGDGTWEDLQNIAANEPRLKLYQHEWDMTNPMLMGAEKQFAREKCQYEYCLQLDMDEILVEAHKNQIKTLLRTNPKVELLSFPVINYFEDDKHIRVDDAICKWRLSKNLPHIIHGVHGAARALNPDTLELTYDKKISDSCLPAGELIYTKEKGLIPIEEAKVGQHVLGHSGDYKCITQTGQRNFNGELCKIQARGFGNILHVTDNHKLLVKRWGQTHWVEAAEVRKDDFVAFTLPKRNQENIVYDLTKYADFTHKRYWAITDSTILSRRNKQIASRFIKLDTQLAWLFGFYAAEGSSCRHCIRFTTHIDEIELRETAKTYFKNVFNMDNFYEHKRANVHGFDLICGMKGIREFFKLLCGTKAAAKRVPYDVLHNVDDEILLSFLNGFMAGDGSFNKSKDLYEFNTASSTLAYELFILLSHIGYNANIRKIHNGHYAKMPNGKYYQCAPIWRVYYFTNEHKKGCRYVIENKTTFLQAQIRQKHITEYNGVVYNIQVEDDASYMTNAIHVKNCEYIDPNTLSILPTVSILPPQCHQLHEQIRQLRLNGQEIPTTLVDNYKNMMLQIYHNTPFVKHLSWQNLDTKVKRGEFWSETWHGKNDWTHNTTSDIQQRIDEAKELVIEVDFEEQKHND